MNRRDFVKSFAAVASSVAGVGCVSQRSVDHSGGTSVKAVAEMDAGYSRSASGKLIISAPMLQNPAPTSMGVAFAVSAMANGFVEYSEFADMRNARKVKCGGFRVTDMNDKVMLVRLTGLKPSTKYFYRIGADRIFYGGGYKMRIIGVEQDPRVYTFTTSGEDARSHFCVYNDTHAKWEEFAQVTDKVAELNPAVVIWNGDACNTQETIESLRNIFLAPPIERRDYASEMPVCFVPGNHDMRGMACRRLEKVVMFRQPEERLSRDWDLGRNFAFRQGDIALIGLDTAEDKLDSRDVFAGLFCSEPYRVAQTAWLADALERPEIKSAPYIVAFCHIPLFDSDPTSNPGDIYPNDTDPRYRTDFASWQRACSKMWGPLFIKAGVQLVVTAHTHKYRYDAPVEDRPWAHLVAGGWRWNNARGQFQTVIEGKTENGKLKVTVHDIYNKKIVKVLEFSPRKAANATKRI